MVMIMPDLHHGDDRVRYVILKYRFFYIFYKTVHLL